MSWNAQNPSHFCLEKSIIKKGFPLRASKMEIYISKFCFYMCTYFLKHVHLLIGYFLEICRLVNLFLAVIKVYLCYMSYYYCELECASILEKYFLKGAYLNTIIINFTPLWCHFNFLMNTLLIIYECVIF